MPVAAEGGGEVALRSRNKATAGQSVVTLVGGWRETFARCVGATLVLAAVWSLISLAIRTAPFTRHVNDLFGLVNLPVSANLFSVAMLMVLAGAVRRRVRLAWMVLFAFQLLAAVFLLGVLVGRVLNALPHRRVHAYTTGYLIVNAVVTVVLIGALWAARGAFASRLRPYARWRALVVLTCGLAVSIGTAVVLTLALPGGIRGERHQVAWSVRAALGLDSSAAGLTTSHHHAGHHWIATLAGVLSAASLIAAVIVLLRAGRNERSLNAQDELTVRGLLLRDGQRDSLGYFATRRDKCALVAPNRRAALTYRVVAGVSLASADPIGAPERWPQVIDAWLREARGYGWFTAVLAASEEGARAYMRAGLRALPIGDEAIIDVDAFRLDSPAMQPVRRAYRRIQRAGYVISVHRHAELSAAQLAELEAKAELWRMDETERGFSMALGRLGDPADGRCVAVLAHDEHGRLRGFLSMVPWGPRGLSLDLMRRDHSAENGLIEAMVAQLVLSARDQLGVQRISLNFAMFRGVFSAAERVGSGPMVRATSRVLSFASRFWQIESLYRSNARYQPIWQTRYLCYDGAFNLTRISLAAGIAEGFVPTPFHPAQRSADGEVSYRDERLPFRAAVQRQYAQITAHEALPAVRLTEQQRVRLHKVDLLRAAGMDPYPAVVDAGDDLASLRHEFGALPPDRRTGREVAVIGRVRALRRLGGLTYVRLADGVGQVQLMLERHAVGIAAFDLFNRTVDLGDHLSARGELITTRRGELSVAVSSWRMAAKALRPLPDERAGFTDPDARVRQRQLDLIVNPDARAMLLRRSATIRQLRESFARRGFVEVETPMLQSVHGGANARPFLTHINAYDATLYLRIAPELHLKRLCVGGMARIFELNRNFRNEGADATHNPEFTSVEAYQAYTDYLGMREMTRALVIEAAQAVHGAPIALRPGPDGGLAEVDLGAPWRSVTVHDAVAEALDAKISPDTATQDVLAACRDRGVAVPSDLATPGELISYLYEELVEPNTTAPTFYLDFPVETSPLTRTHRNDPRLAERWDLVAFGMELATAYSELIDPADQRRRLTAQSLRAAAGDPEAMQLDEAFLTALESGMPPTGGMGMGVDRLVMLLTGANIRQTLAFPFVRPGGR